jgi:hypothetical protein
MAPRRLGLAAYVGALVTIALIAGSPGASAGRSARPGQTNGHHCVNEFGVDYNNLFRVSDQFRTFECRTILAGEPWIPFGFWATDDGVDSVYPEGYVPTHQNPVDDFTSKLVVLKVVVDGGTAEERTQSFSASEAVRTDVNAEQLQPGAWPVPTPMAAFLPRAQTPSVGEHTYQIVVVLSDEHCDGLGPVRELQCLPAGPIEFTGVRPLTISRPTR